MDLRGPGWLLEHRDNRQPKGMTNLARGGEHTRIEPADQHDGAEIADAMQEAELLDSVAGGELQIQDDRRRRRSTDQRLELVLARDGPCVPAATIRHRGHE